MNVGRIIKIAKNVFWEAIRDRILYLIVFFALLMVVAVRLIPELSIGTEDKIILDLGLATIGILGLIVTVFIGTGLVNKEIEKRTVYVLLAKPLSRSELIVGKHIGLSAVLVVLLAAMTLIYGLILSLSGIYYPIVSILVTVIFIFIQLSLLTAVAILFGVFTSSLLATLFTFGIYLMGNLSRDLVKLGDLSDNPGIKKLMMGLYVVLPDLSRLDLKNDAVYGLLPSMATLVTNFGYALLYIMLVLSITIAIFARKEF
ncbi:MAG: ABC transporter permease [Okeania sp. SIO3I5]|uniref:ABC transporter permease n=2 Tax=Okeania sp. SIO3I5 TaxID=2607805 RepID=UPI0013B6C1F4|nr:ABC transporter permease [Okeania sp. SIO3I5]NEQ41373.1 ABC transporter permease [Okeania sp. SIO3I5]